MLNHLDMNTLVYFYIGQITNFLDMKKRNSVPGYGPEYTRPGNDPLGVGNNSEIYSDMVMPNIYIIKFS